MQELPFLHSARRLMLIDICMKFREDSFRGFQVRERTRFVTDRRTSGRPGKNNMSPNPSGGDIIHVIVILWCSAPLASVAISVSVGVHLNCKDIIGIVWS